MQKFALIPSKGLGDLMVTLGLAYNLSKQYKVCLYHPLAIQLQHLLPAVEPHNRPEDIKELEGFEHCLLVYEDSPFFERWYPKLKALFQEKLLVLNPVVTERKDYLFSDHFFFNPKISFSDNLLNVASARYLKAVEPKISGCIAGSYKEPKLVIFHVTASKEAKSWSKKRFLYLKAKLEKEGFKVIYATLPHEKKAVEQGFYSGLQTLKELAEYVAKSSLVIGNESGVCHLASALNTPSLVLCRNRRIQRFWGASFQGPVHALFPPSWIPNIKNFRLRDKFWKWWISKRVVYKKALCLLEKGL